MADRTPGRRDAFIAATTQLGIKHRYISVKEHSDLAAGREATRKLLSSGKTPTAILCVNDLFAMGALRELRSRNISVPGEMSVTGFDNIEISEFTTPSLTTINIPRERIATNLFKSLSTPAEFALGNVRVLLRGRAGIAGGALAVVLRARRTEHR